MNTETAKNDNISVYLDLEPINPKKQKRELDAKDYANEYTIKIARHDGQKVTEDEAISVLFAFMMNRNAMQRRRRK